MAHFLLFYEAGEKYLARRAEFRAAHLKLAWEAVERGELLLAGALGEPAGGAVLLFAGETAEAAERFARADPYVTGGLVRRWRVRPWITVAGPACATPVRPEDVGFG